jgi:hypothetical protein
MQILNNPDCKNPTYRRMLPEKILDDLAGTTRVRPGSLSERVTASIAYYDAFRSGEAALC